MAAVRVLISRGSRHLHDWEEDDSFDLSEEDWRKSSTLWPEDCLKNPSRHPERPKVFLRLDEESLAQGYENDFLAHLIDEVGPHMWGAEIYVLLHREMELISTIIPEEIPRPSPQEMFDLFLEKGVSDVLHWPERAKNLGEAVTRSARRMARISIPDPGRRWRCFVHQPPNLGPQQEVFLHPFLIRSISKLNDENCLVVLQENRDPDQYMKFLEYLSSFRFPGLVMIGVIDRLGHLPPEVLEFCSRKNYELIGFHGLVELYYFLLRLNRGSETSPELLDVAFSIRVKQPTFKSHRPKLLVTHSYSRSAEEDCLAAARDTWELIKELHGVAEIIIYPAVHVIQLADVMDNLQDVFAWVHIGHGREDGLRQSSDELYKSAKYWLSAFGGYGRRSSLSLAVFSSCKSAPVAELFAAAGTGVAIGFRTGIAQDKCSPLTKRVVRAALEWAGSKDRILNEFLMGRGLIEESDENNKPVAYWSRS